MAEVTSRGSKKAFKAPPTEAEVQIRTLAELCREGKLFAVQEWITAGKPVNPPSATRKGIHPQTPLEIAIERGFHSLVEVLLKGGADIQADKWNGPMDRALKLRRLDLAQLLVAHGYDPKSIRMRDVFETWDPEIMEFFIDHGADVETEYPVAEALKNRVRTVLCILKRYGEQFPHLQKQANLALRHHCREGDLKWVSLLLWAGADPYDESSDWPDDGEEHDEGTSALTYAALYQHFQIFNLRGIKLRPDHHGRSRGRGGLQGMCAVHFTTPRAHSGPDGHFHTDRPDRRQFLNELLTLLDVGQFPLALRTTCQRDFDFLIDDLRPLPVRPIAVGIER